jgi:putative ABC transport system ATP-binding protein
MQRVAIARALVVNPLLILADEPTGNLDSETSKTILALFRELNEKGATIVVVSHEAAVASQCRRIVRLLEGRVVGDEVCT